MEGENKAGQEIVGIHASTLTYRKYTKLQPDKLSHDQESNKRDEKLQENEKIKIKIITQQYLHEKVGK